MYNYQDIRPELLKPEGQRLVLAVMDAISRVYQPGRLFTDKQGLEELQPIVAPALDTFTFLACLDYLVEHGVLREVPAGEGYHGHIYYRREL